MPYQSISLGQLEEAERQSAATLRHLLAIKFNYDVKQGGFAQLIYNMQGNYLADIEDMLVDANATVAHTYYVRAIHMCLERQEDYGRFLESAYSEANELKHRLQLLSVEYLQRGKDFADEARGSFDIG